MNNDNFAGKTQFGDYRFMEINDNIMDFDLWCFICLFVGFCQTRELSNAQWQCFTVMYFK